MFLVRSAVVLAVRTDVGPLALLVSEPARRVPDISSGCSCRSAVSCSTAPIIRTAPVSDALYVPNFTTPHAAHMTWTRDARSLRIRACR